MDQSYLTACQYGTLLWLNVEVTFVLHRPWETLDTRIERIRSFDVPGICA